MRIIHIRMYYTYRASRLFCCVCVFKLGCQGERRRQLRCPIGKVEDSLRLAFQLTSRFLPVCNRLLPPPLSPLVLPSSTVSWFACLHPYSFDIGLELRSAPCSRLLIQSVTSSTAPLVVRIWQTIMVRMVTERVKGLSRTITNRFGMLRKIGETVQWVSVKGQPLRYRLRPRQAEEVAVGRALGVHKALHVRVVRMPTASKLLGLLFCYICTFRLILFVEDITHLSRPSARYFTSKSAGNSYGKWAQERTVS